MASAKAEAVKEEFLAFLHMKECERCKGSLKIRTMSWFTNEVICGACSEKEYELRKSLREQGDKTDYEACGYIPKLKHKEA